MSHDQIKIKILYGCQICGEKFVLEITGPRSPEPKLFIEHANCKGFANLDLKEFKGYGIIIGVKR